MSPAEQALLSVFRDFLVGPGEMLCFCGPTRERHQEALRTMTDKGLLVKERFRGGYSLTRTGFAAMTACEKTSG